MTEIPKESKTDSRITKRLCEIVGEKNATDMKHIRYAYSYDLSFVKPKLPDYVVMPTSVEQVQGIMKFANQEKISVTPFTAGSNIGGLCIPENGGILLEMRNPTIPSLSPGFPMPSLPVPLQNTIFGGAGLWDRLQAQSHPMHSATESGA